MISRLSHLVKKYVDDELKIDKSALKIDWSEITFPEQYDFIIDSSPISMACGSRRKGKSVSAIYSLICTAIQNWEYDCYYITKTRSMGEEILWSPLKTILSDLGISYHANNSKLTIKLKKTGSTIYFKSVDDRESIHKLRGRKAKLCVVDEAQNIGEYLEDLIIDVLIPLTEDLQGSIKLLGTPNESCSGYFMDCVSEKRYPLHKWTWRQNKFFVQKAIKESKKYKNADDILNGYLAKVRLPATHPKIQREWFGNLIRSEDYTVYKYRDFINNKECPKRNKDWSYVMGVDIGFEDASAIVVLGYSPHEKDCYLVYEHKFQHATISILAGHIQSAYNTYNPQYSVMDAGALGKMIQSELNNKFSFYLDAAEKSRKSEYIAIANDELLLGRVLIPGDSDLAEEMRRLTWDENKYKKGIYCEQDGLDNHLCDAFLYAFRKAYHYLSRAPEKKVFEGTAEWFQEIEEKYSEALEQNEEEELGDSFYD